VRTLLSSLARIVRKRPVSAPRADARAVLASKADVVDREMAIQRLRIGLLEAMVAATCVAPPTVGIIFILVWAVAAVLVADISDSLETTSLYLALTALFATAMLNVQQTNESRRAARTAAEEELAILIDHASRATTSNEAWRNIRSGQIILAHRLSSAPLEAEDAIRSLARRATVRGRAVSLASALIQVAGAGIWVLAVVALYGAVRTGTPLSNPAVLGIFALLVMFGGALLHRNAGYKRPHGLIAKFEEARAASVRGESAYAQNVQARREAGLPAPPENPFTA
jgi:hypothetical protein